MPDPSKNAVIFILDRSGSMEAIKGNTINSFNGYLEELKQNPGTEFTFVQFDTIGTDIIHRRVPIGEVPDLTPETFQPRGGTPLIDAAHLSIEAAKEKYTREDRVVITILTDGHENSSVQYKMEDLHKLIKELSGWGWQFVFLGASIDVYADAGKAGIAAGATVSFDSTDRRKSAGALRGMAMSTNSYLASGQSINFSDEEKAAVGDKFRPQTGAATKVVKPTGQVLGHRTSLVDKPNL